MAKISLNLWNEPLLSLTPLTDGYFNAAYLLTAGGGLSGVLKVAPSENVKVLSYEKQIMDAEVSVMERVAKHTEIPVPKLYCYDKSHTILESPYLVMEKLEGGPYSHLKEKISAEKRVEIERQLGRYNRELHNIKSSSFGLYGRKDHSYNSWFDCFYEMINMILLDGKQAGVKLPVKDDIIRGHILSLKKILNVVKTPVLVHWDLWDGNLFVKDNKITGIIDFERALWGDPLMEVYFYKEDNESYLKGYGEEICNTPHFDIRRSLYALYMALVVVIEYPYRQYNNKKYQHWTIKNFKEAYSNFLRTIE